MDGPKELSISEIESFLLRNGGKVTNHDLVKHFKPFLTDPATREEARETFKSHVNTLALIKTDKGVKYIILKKKKSVADLSLESHDQIPNPKIVAQRPVNLPISEPLSPRQPPPYRPPPVVTPTSSLNSPSQVISPSNGSNIDISTPSSRSNSVLNTPLSETRRLNTPEINSIPFVYNETPAKVQRKTSSNDLLILEREIRDNSDKDMHVENPISPLKFPVENDQEDSHVALRSSSEQSLVPDNEHNISVKERTQKFNRLASITGDNPKQPLKKKNNRGSEEDDRASVVSLDQKSHDWILKAATADYQALAKMAYDDPKLVGVKDPATTVLHWASKQNREDIVKMAAGIRKSVVNVRSNGGYTPLHIAMQFRNEELGRLLIEVYGANQNLRDWSGKKARQYLTNENMSISDDISNKVKSRKKYSEKDLSFLRIGSLNMRVKKTTSAFSNFLGVGAGGVRSMGSGIKNLNSPTARNSTPLDFSQETFSKDAMHKSWGSADNIQDEDNKQMPCPHTNKVKRKVAKKGPDYVNAWKSRSTPTTPHQIRSKLDKEGSTENVSPSPSSSIATQQDSDSDTACGFDAQWQDQPKSRTNLAQ